MKTIFKLTLLAALTLFFNCNEVDELTDIKIEQTFETDVNIDSNDFTRTPEGTTTINESTTLDISTDPRIKDGLELIENVDINAININIEDYAGDPDAELTDIKLIIGGNEITLPGPINLKDAFTNKTDITIGDQATLTRIASALKQNPEIDIDFSGVIKSSGAPISFTPNFTIDTTVILDVI